MASDSASPPSKTSGRNSVEDEENLPLYEEFQEDASSVDALPDKKATPDQVREFITNLLVTKRNLPLDYSRRAAAKWSAGSGEEIRSYTPTMYLDIFGREDGWIIYREVRLVTLENEKKKAPKFEGVSFFIGVAILLMFDALLWYIAFFTNIKEGFQIAAGICAMPVTFLTVGCSVAACVTACGGLPTPEKTVEKELRQATTPHREPGS